MAAGYFALDKLVLSKRTAALSIAALPGEFAAGEVSEKSIAVLPFADMSEKKDQEYFSDGLAEELLDLLAKTPGLHVIARTSSFSFKGKSDDIPTIARKLHVANIRRSGRGTTETQARPDAAVRRPSHLEPRTSNLEPRTSNLEPRTSNLEAYNEYLLGREFNNRGNLDGYKTRD